MDVLNWLSYCDSREDRYAPTGPSLSRIQEQTPPRSASGSPECKTEGNIKSYRITVMNHLTKDIAFEFGVQDRASSPASSPVSLREDPSPTRLPSLEEFDQGVQALAQADGRINDQGHMFRLPSISSNVHTAKSTDTSQQPRAGLLHSAWPRTAVGLVTDDSASRRMSLSTLNRSTPSPSHDAQLPYRSYRVREPLYRSPADYQRGVREVPSTDFQRSPSPDNSGYHTNQQYTTEEGDFIIYARHDKRMKWSCIEEEFAVRFGHSPKRTVPGLQAWHYRINNRIPVWDKDGWLCFDKSDDLKPREASIKCRERDNLGRSMDYFGLAQRYPERAIYYPWVDQETKDRARDWGMLHSNVHFKD